MAELVVSAISVTSKNYYSQNNLEVLNPVSRNQKAFQIWSILKTCLENKPGKKLRLLDIGCSGGIITVYLARHIGEVVGIDTDRYAIGLAQKNFKRRNLTFKPMDAEKLNFSPENFDVVVCNQVYECVKDQSKMADEMYRVLKKGGVCFFGGVNKYSLGKNQVSITSYLNYWELRDLFRKFIIHSYTAEIIKNPARYNFAGLNKSRLLWSWLPDKILKKIEPLSPNFIWILEKP